MPRAEIAGSAPLSFPIYPRANALKPHFGLSAQCPFGMIRHYRSIDIIKSPFSGVRVPSSDILGLPYGLQIPGSCCLNRLARAERTSTFERANGTPRCCAHSTKKALRYAPVVWLAARLIAAGAALDLGKEARPTAVRPELLQCRPVEDFS